MTNFYNKVARKFGGYAFGKHHPKYLSKYPNGDPEKIFKKKLLGLVNPDKIALDVGCGDGKFTFKIAEYFPKIIGIDTSQELLKIARAKQKSLKVDNVVFKFQDACQTLFESVSFDVVYCRRGPSFFKEYYRILKNGGYYLEIGIGEKDTLDLKNIFGRGQGFSKWNESRLVKDKKELKEIGFGIIYAKEFIYDEYYPSYKELDFFLQGVPIFEDFDSVKDREYLIDYCRKYQTKKGIRLNRHRVVFVVQK